MINKIRGQMQHMSSLQTKVPRLRNRIKHKILLDIPQADALVFLVFEVFCRYANLPA